MEPIRRIAMIPLTSITPAMNRTVNIAFRNTAR
jgi:hypothetical protein